MERKDAMAAANQTRRWKRAICLYVTIAVIMGGIAILAAGITLQAIGLISIP